MRTEAQIEASRTNGSKSQGPITEEGKAASSRNAIRHGLLSQTIVFQGESEERFHNHLDALVHEYEPQTETEMALVEKMAVARWRQLSVWGLETAGISDEVNRQIEEHPEILDKDPAVRAFIAMKEMVGTSTLLNVLNRYDVRFDRAYYRALHDLKAHQKERNSKRTREM
jgi:hypothetical protein